ncbi:MAG: hypothetical protein WCC54_14020, partial [Pseudolabrys sp.]
SDPKGKTAILSAQTKELEGIAMSALSQKRTCAAQKVMSALPSKADVCGAIWDVCFVPIADIFIFQFGLSCFAF